MVPRKKARTVSFGILGRSGQFASRQYQLDRLGRFRRMYLDRQHNVGKGIRRHLWDQSVKLGIPHEAVHYELGL